MARTLTADPPATVVTISAVSHTGDAEAKGVGQTWSNEPGVVYEWHSHPYDKLLVCVEGSITFHTRVGDYQLRSGERLQLAAGTAHAATVGPDGVTCREFRTS
jgi:quercetin dioxygenase-like cupin family protein